jgi:hypothetical protein
MHLLNSVRLLGSFLRPGVVHLHRLATAGAMLICIAIVLNVGPFAKAPKIDSLPDTAIREAAQATTERPVASISVLQLEIGAPNPDQRQSTVGVADVSESITPLTQPASVSVLEAAPQSAMGAADVCEPIKLSTEPASISVAEVAASASQPATAKNADGEVQSNLPQQDLAAAVPAAQPSGDQVNPDLMKGPAIVGVWAPDAGTCSARDFREGMLPAVINADGAWAGDTFCVFEDKKQTETAWSVVAKCSNPREHWTAKVRLTVHNNRLTWTSRRGTQVYTRCAPDVLMADAR